MNKRTVVILVTCCLGLFSFLFMLFYNGAEKTAGRQLPAPYAWASARTVTVGVYENAPKVFTSESGKPAGIFIDIIESIAKSEGWNLRYVPGTWAEGLDRLAKGEIDLMPDVAYTAEREKIYSFHKVPVLSVWSQVYARSGSGIKSILDLNGKRVAALEQTIQLETFQRLTNSFELKITLIPVPDYKTEFEMIARGKADAGVTNRFYGLMYARKFGLEDTPIMFDPAPFFFAAPSNASRELLDIIDRHLEELKKDPRSAYYATMNRWTSEEVQFKLPAWLQILGLVTGMVLLMSLAGSFFLKHQVNARTRELRTSEQRYRHLFEQNPAPMLIYERGTLRILAVNAAFLSSYGYNEEEALVLRLPDLYPEEEQARIAELVARLSGHAYVGEWHHLRKDGSLIDIVARSHDLTYDGRSARIAVITDITDRKQAEKALRYSEQKFMKAFHATPDAIVISRAADGLLLEVNEVFLRLAGYSRDEVSNKTTVDLGLWADPVDRERYVAGVREQGRVRDMEARFRMKTGTILDGLVSGESILLGNDPCLLTIIRDVTERKKTEKELEKHRLHLEEMVSERTDELNRSREALRRSLEDVTAAKKDLEEANARLQELDRLKSLFIASMSHELRTPMNSIIGFTGILLQGLAGELNAEQRKQLGMVKSSAEHLLSLITDIIDLSKIEAGKIDLSMEPFDLSGVVREILGSFQVMAERKSLSLSAEIPSGIILVSDKRRIRQVLVNLVGNAMKFTEQGGVSVTARRMRRKKEVDAELGPQHAETDGDFMEVSVADTGMGIKGEDLDKLFKSFSQVTTAESPKREGTGLGLYLSKRLVTLLGGEIGVESEFGKGSVFSFTLPMKH